MDHSSQTLTSHIPLAVNRSRNSNSNGNGTGNANGSGTRRPGETNSNGRSGPGRNSRNKPRNNQQGRPSWQSGSGASNENRSNVSAPPRREESPQNGSDVKTEISAQTKSGPSLGLDPFKLFSAYHLGIGPNNDYKPANINEVARRFQVDPAQLRQALTEHNMDSGSLLEKDFDMALAQLDMQVAPEGVDRTELAKTLYQEFLEAPILKRDWNKMLDEDRKENMKIFGQK